MSRPHHFGCLLAVLLTIGTVAADEIPVDFQRDVQPIFRRHCYRCHGPRKSEGGLRLSSRQAAFGESDSGVSPIQPGDPEGSMLMLRLTDRDYGDVMPLDGEPLGKDQIAVIRRWIEQGAKWPDVAAEDRHWAYVKPTRPTLPAVKQANWPRNAIDRFILAKLEREGISPSPEADRAKLIRRVSLALIGLPPSPEEVEAFVNDRSPEAYERLVDRLLRSERFGERWAQRWLDLARYADSNGFQADQLRDSWAYRDWVIRAFNESKPFDEFVVEQLAGDLIPGASLDQKIATGFHRTTPCNVEAGVQPEENRTNQVIDRVNTTGLVFLGTTLECCQCHDHKYDPFTQRDYYRLFAYFNNTPLEVELDSGVRFDFVGPTMDLPLPPEKDARRQQLQTRLTQVTTVRDARRKERLAGFAAWNDVVTAAVQDGVAVAGLPDDVQKILAKKKRAKKDTQRLRDHYANADPKLAKLNREVAGIEKRLKATAPPTTLVMVEMDQPRETHIFQRGDYLSPGEAVIPGTPAVLHPLDDSLPPNRLGFATWLASPENPLLARVTVNRWWSALFGQGLVTTPEDFGTQGEPPTHPELLDWLAVELVESGWDMKHVLRLMATSAAFRQSAECGMRNAELAESTSQSSGTPHSALRTPHSEHSALYSRGPRFRLPAEAIRDNALKISGLLATEMYGPPIMPYQPEGIWRAVGRNAPKWQTATDADRFRRGVYVVCRRAAAYPSFITFDAPDRTACVVQRARTNTPLQALTLLNDPVYAEAAVALAQRMMNEAPSGTPESRAAYGMQLCTAREPRDEEVDILVRLYQMERKKLIEEPKLIEERLKNLLPRLRDKSLDPTDLAAWFAVANTLLNLDETITIN